MKKKSTIILVVFGHCSHNHQTLIITAPSHEISESNKWTGKKKTEHERRGLQIWDHVCYFKHLFGRVKKFETEPYLQYVWKKKNNNAMGCFGETVHVQPGSTKKSPPVLESTLFTCEKTWKKSSEFHSPSRLGETKQKPGTQEND